MLSFTPARRNVGAPALLTLLALLLGGTAATAQTEGVMMQYFHWYVGCSDNLWQQVADQADDLAAAGITALWLPPATKAIDGCDVGYGVYDLYDLGEFSQKGSTRTKYGDKSEYMAAIAAAQAEGMDVYFDVVLNHKGGADATQSALAVRVNPNDRNQEWGSDVLIDAWTSFTFPGRGSTYSSFQWQWFHFDGVDWAQNLQESNTIYKFRGTGKAWDTPVSSEFGNYDYLLYADVDFSHSDVTTELQSWGTWLVNHTGVDGFRLDAVKHIPYGWWNGWLDHVRTQTGQPLFTVSEYWDYDLADLLAWLDATKRGDGSPRAHLFDAPLHINFFNASNGGAGYDMRTILDGTLVAARPDAAVTLVDNHDTQPLQALASPVQDWFKPLAYAFILLREDGYPNVFYADYYGASYYDQGQQVNLASHKTMIDLLLAARRDYAHGPQIDYLDHWDIVGWTRLGDAQHPDSMAVLITDGPGGSKSMQTGQANTTFVDLTGNHSGTVTTDGSGWGQFQVNGGSVSVWVPSTTPPPPPGVSASFTCANGTTVWGQNVYVVGSIPELGSWNPANAVKLDPSAYPTWDKVISGLPASTYVEWKCIKRDVGSVVWQPGANNSFTTPASGQGSTSGSF